MRAISCLITFAMLAPVGVRGQTPPPLTPTANPETGKTEVQMAVRPGSDTLAGLASRGTEKWALFGYGPFSATQQAINGGSALPLTGTQTREVRAFRTIPPESGVKRSTAAGKVELILACLAVHAAVTWDAQSTNHFFHHYPAGYRPAELDPLMRPFAGHALMYPMSNLLFAVPFDFLLFKTRHSRKSVEFLSRAAAGLWVGSEIHQSIANIENEHIRK